MVPDEGHDGVDRRTKVRQPRKNEQRRKTEELFRAATEPDSPNPLAGYSVQTAPALMVRGQRPTPRFSSRTDKTAWRSRRTGTSSISD